MNRDDCNQRDYENLVAWEYNKDIMLTLTPPGFETASDSPQGDPRMVSTTSDAIITVDSSNRLVSKSNPTELPNLDRFCFGVEFTSPEQERDVRPFRRGFGLSFKYCEPDFSKAINEVEITWNIGED